VRIYETLRIDYMPSLKKPTPSKKSPTKKVAAKKLPKKTVKEEKEVEMELFTCKACSKKFPDMGSYFYGKKSEKCLWCAKFPGRAKR